jgi:serine O-acetyltransferase
MCPKGPRWSGIPARPTLVDADQYNRQFVPYGTPCNELNDPAAQKLMC